MWPIKMKPFIMVLPFTNSRRKLLHGKLNNIVKQVCHTKKKKIFNAKSFRNNGLYLCTCDNLIILYNMKGGNENGRLSVTKISC